MKSSILLLSATLSFWLAGSVQAQMRDVPSFDHDGNFWSAIVEGNRGVYPQVQWLVVDTDPVGLNCRDENGSVVRTLRYGSVMDAVFDDEAGHAIALKKDGPWLRVKVSTLDVSTQVTDEIAEMYTCYVRANTRYIAPINPDSLNNQI